MCNACDMKYSSIPSKYNVLFGARLKENGVVCTLGKFTLKSEDCYRLSLQNISPGSNTDILSIPINYCPMCGRKLSDENE